jgi:hypothetical protein
VNNEFLENILPAPFTVLGKKLRPFSIGRAILLQRFDCYPVTDFEKLITAVVICSRPCKDVLATLEDKWLPIKIRLWAFRLGRFDPMAKIVFFNQYLRAYSSCPNVFSEDSFNDDCVPGAPFLQHMRVLLRAEVGWTQEEINEEPLSQAYWDYFTYWEMKDKVRIIQEEEDWVRAMVDDANAKHEERLQKARSFAE